MDCGPNNPEDFSIGELPEGEYYDILTAGRSCSCSDDGTSLCLNGNKGVASQRGRSHLPSDGAPPPAFSR